jgi:phospholipid/cholesterol/gamma-HCH transport system substrate-binding protein/paraquat-inducible protein B
MSEQARYLRVGAFVLGGLLLAVAFVLLVGGGSLLRRPLVVETVFTESVQGLDVGSPVKLRGVKIGTASSIGFVGDVYDLQGTEDPIAYRNLVLVRMEIELEGASESRDALEKEMAALVERGLRLQLAPLGITGTFFLQADYLDPTRYPPMKITWKPSNLYVPSAPSTLTQFSSAADRLITRIDKLDVESLLTNLDTLLSNVNQVVERANASGIGPSVNSLLDDARKTSAAVRGAVEKADLEHVTAEARQALTRLGGALGRVERLLDSTSEDLGTTLENLRVASANLRDASETARSYPSLLLFGQPPKPSAGEARP